MGTKFISIIIKGFKSYYQNYIFKNNFRIYKIFCKYIAEPKDIVPIPNAINHPNRIWTMLYQGENNAPIIVKKCINSIRKFHPEKEIIVINKNNLRDYIDIPEYITNKLKYKKITYTHLSDYVRTCLLVKYGGTWIDSTVLLTGRIPDEILNQDFFVFKNPLWHSTIIPPYEKLYLSKISLDNDFGANWFIKTNANNIILLLIKLTLENYWRCNNCITDYFMYHKIASIIIFRYEECRKIFGKMYSLPKNVPHFIFKLLYEPFDEFLFNEIKSLTSIHKLTYKFEHIPQGSFADYLLKEDFHE